ncbi:alpha/beta hydrolase [Vibrio panuliri]|uniref:Alpha/beta hydrolase fold-3 domain-containing protein n=1 Tax=Vibrio panuliri TaxID=1381081 RepID=A0ABX3FR69_9VIBR|nr:alpha/beta hydrolase [Vibrio panuliri]KAB1457846.1 alpha/beta hydrolase [Vibrio panuliri]OLQ96270.1 hypothetical protein BIY20_19545 [Vibrio panuliri]
MKRILAALVLSSCSMVSLANHFHVPTTISQEGQEFFTAFFPPQMKETAIPPAMTKQQWRDYQAKSDLDVKPLNDFAKASYQTNIQEAVINHVPVLDVRPVNWKDNGKVLVYTHGGAYVGYSAASTLPSVVPVAAESGMRVISVDYTLAPHAQYQEITDQVISVLSGLVDSGYAMNDIAIYGDSAGGGLAAGTLLKMRDKGMDLPAAVVLWSPWSDITETGDTYHTLAEAEPLYRYDRLLKPSADAYAPVSEQKHPYVSPVYGDFTKPFPPTLIQVGTKELFVSNAVRLYQAIDSNGGNAKLDMYEGMWHVFQSFSFQIPEAKLARKKMFSFVNEAFESASNH